MKKRHWYLLASLLLAGFSFNAGSHLLAFVLGAIGGVFFWLWVLNLFKDSRKPSTVSNNWEVVASTGPPPSARDRKVMDQMMNHVLKTGKPCCGTVDEDGNLHIKDIDNDPSNP